MAKAPKNNKNIKYQKDNTTRNLTLGMVLFVVVTGVFFSLYSNKVESNIALPLNVASKDKPAISLNNEIKSTIIDIWEDFQCPICNKFEQINGETINNLIKEKKAQVNFHILSFLGQESVQLANAAACSSDEGKFNEFHSNFYALQKPENSGYWTVDNILKESSNIGLESNKYISCVKNGKYLPYVNAVASFGAKSNVNSTPTVFVNGKELDRNSDYFDNNNFVKKVS